MKLTGKQINNKSVEFFNHHHFTEKGGAHITSIYTDNDGRAIAQLRHGLNPPANKVDITNQLFDCKRIHNFETSPDIDID